MDIAKHYRELPKGFIQVLQTLVIGIAEEIEALVFPERAGGDRKDAPCLFYSAKLTQRLTSPSPIAATSRPTNPTSLTVGVPLQSLVSLLPSLASLYTGVLSLHVRSAQPACGRPLGGRF